MIFLRKNWRLSVVAVQKKPPDTYISNSKLRFIYLSAHFTLFLPIDWWLSSDAMQWWSSWQSIWWVVYSLLRFQLSLNRKKAILSANPIVVWCDWRWWGDATVFLYSRLTGCWWHRRRFADDGSGLDVSRWLSFNATAFNSICNCWIFNELFGMVNFSIEPSAATSRNARNLTSHDIRDRNNNCNIKLQLNLGEKRNRFLEHKNQFCQWKC